jgi:hypothetical protein
MDILNVPYVPQDSLLGPVLFSICTNDTPSTANGNIVAFSMYTDDKTAIVQSLSLQLAVN